MNLKVNVQNFKNEPDLSTTILEAFTIPPLSLDVFIINHILATMKAVNVDDIDYMQISREIIHVASNVKAPSKFLHTIFEDFMDVVKDDYYRYIEATITCISKHAGRKIPWLNDLIIYASIIPKWSQIEWMNLIINRLFNLKQTIYHDSNDFLGIEDKSSYQEIRKIKQKYSHMFLLIYGAIWKNENAFWEAYGTWENDWSKTC